MTTPHPLTGQSAFRHRQETRIRWSIGITINGQYATITTKTRSALRRKILHDYQLNEDQMHQLGLATN